MIGQSLTLQADSGTHCAAGGINAQIHRVRNLFIKLDFSGRPEFVTPRWLCGPSSSSARWFPTETELDRKRFCRYCELGYRFPGPHVYFAELHPGVLKIGHTTTMATRFRTHGGLRFLGAMQGNRHLERYYHEIFEEKFGSSDLAGRELFTLNGRSERMVRWCIESNGGEWTDELVPGNLREEVTV